MKKIFLLLIVCIVVLSSCGEKRGVGVRAEHWLPPGAVVVDDIGTNHGYRWLVFELRGQLFLFSSSWYDLDPSITLLDEWEYSR